MRIKYCRRVSSLKISLKRTYGFEFDNNLYSTEFNSPKKSLILSSGLNISKDEVVSPKQKILYWKPDKFKNLKKAAKRWIDNEIPEAAAEDEDEID